MITLISKGMKMLTRTGSKKTDGVCNFTEMPKFFLDIMTENTRLLVLRQDTLLSELKEDFQLKLSEKDVTISDLRKELRSKANELDALAQYTRKDNLKIEGIEYTDVEDTTTIVKEIAAAAGIELKDEDISVSHRIGVNRNREQQRLLLWVYHHLGQIKLPAL